MSDMGLFSFGSKKDKVRKMLETNQIEAVVEQALKDRKVINALFELLNEKNPGIVGDSLLALTNILERDKNLIIRNLRIEHFLKSFDLVKSRNSYVKENAMVFLSFLIKENPSLFTEFKNDVIAKTKDVLLSGDKNDKAFALLMIREFRIAELRPYVEELISVQEKVILPFEGMKWVPLGEIAKDVLRRLEG